MAINQVILLLGSNLGDKQNYLVDACNYIIEEIGEIIKISGVYVSEPWGFESQLSFLNQVLVVQTHLEANEILSKIHNIEKKLGRIRSKLGYQNRTIDIDILFFNDDIIESQSLSIPHPRMHLRRFTLEPLAEIASDFMHPVYSKSVSQLYSECADNAIVSRLEPIYEPV